MVFPNFKAQGFFVPVAISAVGWGFFWEYNGAFLSPLGALIAPELMGRYNAGVVPGVNERGNRQYWRPKVAWDSQAPDYSRYLEDKH